MRPHEDDGCEPSAHTVGLIVSVGMFWFVFIHRTILSVVTLSRKNKQLTSPGMMTCDMTRKPIQNAA